MADEDEIDILGDFSFNSCFAQNDQGIPSCSNREDTVHPQWLLDSTDTNWYDQQSKNVHRFKDGIQRKLLGTNSEHRFKNIRHTEWTSMEKELLRKEMAKHGRNVSKISQTLKTKTGAEIQALIEAEYGVNLDSPSIASIHEVLPTTACGDVTTNMPNGTGPITAPSTNKVVKGDQSINKKVAHAKSKNSLLQPDAVINKTTEVIINSSEILYEDDLIIGSTESVGSDTDMVDIVAKSIEKHQAKAKAERKIGNHRRKTIKSSNKKPRNKSKDMLKSPLGRHRKDSGLSDDSGKSLKMQIILGSGQALPLSEGEQLIILDKESEPESDIEIDIDSDNEASVKSNIGKKPAIKPVSDTHAIPQTKFEPMPKRQKKIRLDGGGGYTIMHTESGDLYRVDEEPKRERQPRKQPIHLLQCRVYNAEKPAPCAVRVHVSALVSMDVQAHGSRAEVMGLAGGAYCGGAVVLRAYLPVAAAAARTHCDMDPVSQAAAAHGLGARGLCVVGWHHSHPAFSAAPSATDLRTQRALQRALERPRRPLLGLISSQHWPPGRTASHYRCIRVEEDDPETGEPIGYQLKVKLVPDLTATNLPAFLQELRGVMIHHAPSNEYTVDMLHDICPEANMTYLAKCISSTRHHMSSAGYEDDHPVVLQLLLGIEDICR